MWRLLLVPALKVREWVVSEWFLLDLADEVSLQYCVSTFAFFASKTKNPAPTERNREASQALLRR